MNISLEELLSLAADMHDFGFESDTLEWITENDSSDCLHESDLDYVSAARSEALPSYEQFLERLNRRS